MTAGTLTLEVVRSWRPEALSEAATKVSTAQEAVDAQVRAARSAMARLTEQWDGEAARAGAERMAKEATTGFELADALDAARAALSSGATDLSRARSTVLSTVDAATAGGFQVAGDGRVTAPTLPPVMTAPGDPDGAGARRDSQQRALNDEAQVHADAIATALGDVATVDQQVADRLAAVEVPQTLRSAVDAYLQRAFESKDVIGALGAVGAGGVALAQVIQGVMKTVGKSRAYLQWWQASTAPVTHYQALLDNIRKADQAADVFMNGKPMNPAIASRLNPRIVAGFRMLGKAFLPVTLVTGGIDAATGGGYEGARGWATRGFGLAGAAGAGTLIAMGTGLLASNPVGWAIAGGAVLAYGAWSLGNLVWDNREAIGDFFQAAGGKIADGWNATTGAVSNAVSDAADWAGEQVDKAKDAVADFGKGALDVLSGGLW